jgi:hypothetical protein
LDKLIAAIVLRAVEWIQHLHPAGFEVGDRETEAGQEVFAVQEAGEAHNVAIRGGVAGLHKLLRRGG